MSYRLNYFYYSPSKQSFNIPLKTFIFPLKMSTNEGFKIISYLMLKCAKDLDIYITSPLVMVAIDSLLESYHFIPVNSDENTKDILNVIGCFNGIRKRNQAYSLLDWFDSTVTKEDIIKIYTRLNLSIPETLTTTMILKYQNLTFI